MQILPGSRYFWRELLPRFVLFTLAFRFLVNFVPGLTFNGGILAASVLSFVMTTQFMLFGAYLYCLPSVQKFVTRHKRSQWFLPAMLAIALFEPALVLAILACLSFGAFTVSGVFAALGASLLFNVGCALTHDYGNPGD